MNLFLLRTDSTRLDQAYAYFWLKANEAYVKGFTCGAATATITKKAVRELEIDLPQLNVQKRIASILLVYEELVEINRQRIKFLESIARTLYREWFVHYRISGRVCAPLVASPLGSIPKGWEICKVADFAEFIRGFEPGSGSYCNEPAPNRMKFLRVGDFGKRDSDIFIPSELAEGRILTPLDIAITLDGSVGLVRVGLAGAYSTGIRKLVVKDASRLGWSFLYRLLLSDPIQATIQAHAKGTTIKHASTTVAALEFVSPPAALVKQFELVAAPMLKQVLNLQNQIQVLRRTRDLLLSRLLIR